MNTWRHRTGRNSEPLASNMSIEDAFRLTIGKNYPNEDPLILDVIQCRREYAAYLQVARQHARTLTGRKRRVFSKWLKYFRHTFRPSQIPDSMQDIGGTSPLIYESEIQYSQIRCFAITKSARLACSTWRRVLHFSRNASTTHFAAKKRRQVWLSRRQLYPWGYGWGSDGAIGERWDEAGKYRSCLRGGLGDGAIT